MKDIITFAFIIESFYYFITILFKIYKYKERNIPCTRGVNAFAKILQSRHVNYGGRDGDEHAHQRAHYSHGTADFHLEKL